MGCVDGWATMFLLLSLSFCQKIDSGSEHNESIIFTLLFVVLCWLWLLLYLLYVLLNRPCFLVRQFFGLGPTSFLSDLLLAGERFCNEDWLKHKKRHHSLDEEELLLYCFSSAYIVALLHDSLGIALDDKRCVRCSMHCSISAHASYVLIECVLLYGVCYHFLFMFRAFLFAEQD